jgi:hypothetical protein
MTCGGTAAAAAAACARHPLLPLNIHKKIVPPTPTYLHSGKRHRPNAVLFFSIFFSPIFLLTNYTHILSLLARRLLGLISSS